MYNPFYNFHIVNLANQKARFNLQKCESVFDEKDNETVLVKHIILWLKSTWYDKGLSLTTCQFFKEFLNG